MENPVNMSFSTYYIRNMTIHLTSTTQCIMISVLFFLIRILLSSIYNIHE